MLFTIYSSHVFTKCSWAHCGVCLICIPQHTFSFCKTAHYIIFASDTDFVLGKCSNNKRKKKILPQGAISLPEMARDFRGHTDLEQSEIPQ